MVQLSFSYTHSDEQSMTKTETISIGITEQFNVPAYSNWHASLMVQMGTLPPNTTYNTTAQRWYDQQLEDSTLDPTNGWYVRTETVTFDMSGSVAVGTTLDVHSTPLDDAPGDVDAPTGAEPVA